MTQPGALARSLPPPGATKSFESDVARVPGPGWVYAYIAVEIGCQLALLFEALAPARVLFRSAAFGTSLLMFAVVPRYLKADHPSKNLAIAAMAILTLSAMNPTSSTPLAIVSHWTFHLAVLAPLFWVMRVRVTMQTLIRVLIIVWVFSTASSVMGMLQVYFPGQFQPAISTLIRSEQVLAIRLSSGAWVPRPMGLTDVPGGAAWSGLYASLFGLGMALGNPFRFARLLGVLSMVAGTSCIYICQVRAMIVTLAICCIVLLGLFALTGRLSRMGFALGVAAVMTLIGFYTAFSVAGETVTSRLRTLVETDPGTLYHMNRGRMVEAAFVKILPQYPLGAGLGRWGMVNQYFGASDLIWVEVQWSGWVVDGGFLLVILYPAAVLVALWMAVRAALKSADDSTALWAAVVAAHGIGTFALSFSYPAFMSTGGIQFWLINAVLARSLATQDEAQAVARPS